MSVEAVYSNAKAGSEVGTVILTPDVETQSLHFDCCLLASI